MKNMETAVPATTNHDAADAFKSSMLDDDYNPDEEMPEPSSVNGQLVDEEEQPAVPTKRARSARSPTESTSSVHEDDVLVKLDMEVNTPQSMPGKDDDDNGDDVALRQLQLALDGKSPNAVEEQHKQPRTPTVHAAKTRPTRSATVAKAKRTPPKQKQIAGVKPLDRTESPSAVDDSTVSTNTDPPLSSNARAFALHLIERVLETKTAPTLSRYSPLSPTLHRSHRRQVVHPILTAAHRAPVPSIGPRRACAVRRGATLRRRQRAAGREARQVSREPSACIPIRRRSASASATAGVTAWRTTRTARARRTRRRTRRRCAR